RAAAGSDIWFASRHAHSANESARTTKFGSCKQVGQARCSLRLAGSRDSSKVAHNMNEKFRFSAFAIVLSLACSSAVFAKEEKDEESDESSNEVTIEKLILVRDTGKDFEP